MSEQWRVFKWSEGFLFFYLPPHWSQPKLQGEFETLGGERAHFGPAPRGFTECRGVVVRGDDGKLVRSSRPTILAAQWLSMQSQARRPY